VLLQRFERDEKGDDGAGAGVVGADAFDGAVVLLLLV
jgi:hypothetical protein